MYYLLGQAFGILATLICILVPLFKKKWQMLISTLLVNFLMILNLICLQQIGSGVFLCTVAVIQCVFSLVHNHRSTQPSVLETGIFFVLYLGLGFYGLIRTPGFQWALTYRNLLELLPILGSVFSMIFVFIREEQRARWFLLGTCAVWSLYTGLIGSTTFFAQFITLLTTLSAMVKYRRQKA